MTSLRIRIRSFVIVAVTGAALAGPLAGITQAANPGPSIAGPAGQGQTLTLTQGTWTGTPPNVSDQWTYCTSPLDPNTCIIPTGQTGTTYPLGGGDVGKYLAVVETGTDTDPMTMLPVTSTATSNIIGPVVGLPTRGALTISGAANQGTTLTSNGGATNWTYSPTTTDQWYNCPTHAVTTACTPVTANGTGTTYVVQAGDGPYIYLSESASNAAGTGTANSNLIGPIVAIPVNAGSGGLPSISGSTVTGQTLIASPGSWSNFPTSYTYQWQRCTPSCTNVGAASATNTYPLTSSDLGDTIDVVVTATNGAGSSTPATSPPTSTVVPPPPTYDAAPGISGTTQSGQTLTEKSGRWPGYTGQLAIQWYRCDGQNLNCTAIAAPLGTAPTYTLTAADVLATMQVSESATNAGGTTTSYSAFTGAVSDATGMLVAPSATAVQTSTSTPVAGQAVTLIASVSSTAESVRPAGTVEFDANGSAIPGCAGLALGATGPTEICQTSFPASATRVTAVYSAAPGTSVTGSASSPVTLIVGRAETTVTVAAAAHVSLGDKTTYTATVHPPAGSTLTPTGRVTFTDGSKTITGCASKALAADKAPCSVKYLGLRQHHIAAHYSGDVNFAPAASITSHVLVKPQAPSGFVAVFMNWSFKFNLHATRVALLDATGLSAGIHITVMCRGAGCPFAHRAITVSARGKCGKHAKSGCVTAPSFDIASIFHRAHLGVGTRVAVAVTHRGWVGKYYRFTIRKGHKPSIDVSCLAVNGTRPGVGCSAR